MIRVGLYRGTEYDEGELLVAPCSEGVFPVVLYEDSKEDSYYMSRTFRLSFMTDDDGKPYLERGYIVPKEDIIPLPDNLEATVQIPRLSTWLSGTITEVLDSNKALETDNQGYYFVTSVSVKEN